MGNKENVLFDVVMMKLNKFAIFAGVAVAGMMLTSVSRAQDPLAVGSIETTKALSEDMARKGKAIELNRVMESLDGHLVSVFAQGGKFTVVGRKRVLKDNKEEQELAQAGVVNKDSGAQAGEAVGAKYRLTIIMDHFLEQNTDAEFNGRKATKRRFQISGQATISDASTSVIVAAPNVQFEKMIVTYIGPTETADAKDTDDLMPKLGQEFAERVALAVTDSIYPAKVIDAEGKTVTINRGANYKMQVGDIYNAYGPSKVRVDPDTKKEIKIKGAFQGRIKITTVDQDSCQADVTEGAVQVGAVVSKPEAPASAVQGNY